MMPNLAAVYGVTIKALPASPVWRAISVRRLPGSENAGSQNVFVKVLKANGDRDRNPALRIGWTWEGRRANEFAPPVKLDKGDKGERGHGDIPINKFQKIEVWISDGVTVSDTVIGLHTNFVSDGPGNTWGHFSYEVIFQYTVGEIVTPPPPPIDSGELVWLRAELAAANAKVAAMRAAIRKACAELGAL